MKGWKAVTALLGSPKIGGNVNCQLTKKKKRVQSVFSWSLMQLKIKKALAGNCIMLEKKKKYGKVFGIYMWKKKKGNIIATTFTTMGFFLPALTCWTSKSFVMLQVLMLWVKKYAFSSTLTPSLAGEIVEHGKTMF